MQLTDRHSLALEIETAYNKFGPWGWLAMADQVLAECATKTEAQETEAGVRLAEALKFIHDPAEGEKIRTACIKQMGAEKYHQFLAPMVVQFSRTVEVMEQSPEDTCIAFMQMLKGLGLPVEKIIPMFAVLAEHRRNHPTHSHGQ